MPRVWQQTIRLSDQSQSRQESEEFDACCLSNQKKTCAMVAIYSSDCSAQSNDGQIYIEKGQLNGRPVKVLRDTGCTGMIVDRALIPDLMVIPGSSGLLQMVYHTLTNVPLANVYLDFPYYKGHCKVMCVSSPVYPVKICNVRGIDPDVARPSQEG